MKRRWIVVRNWDKFQHYKDRDPPWIKDYTEQLDDPAYLELTGVQRAALQGIRLKYAASRRQVLDDTGLLSRQLNMRVTRATLDALNHAGFIQFSASSPLAKRKQPASASRALARELRSEEDLRPEEGLTPQEDLRPKKESAPPVTARPPEQKPVRKPDELWDAFAEALGQPTTRSERGRRNKAVKEIREIGGTPAEVIQAAGRYKLEWPDIALTDTALVANWSRFKNGGPGETSAERFARRLAEHNAKEDAQ